MEIKTWDDALKSIEIPNELKEIIKEFLIPDKILAAEFFQNFTLLGLNNSEATFLQMNNSYGTKSITRYINMGYPPIWPIWFVAAYPDVLRWLLEEPENSRVYSALDDSSVTRFKISPTAVNSFLKAVINEFIIVKDPVLECTQQHKNDERSDKKKKPKKDYDNNGNLVFENFINEDGWDENIKYSYNTIGLLIRIDKWGEDSYGDYELKPFEIFEYDIRGVLTHYVQYEHGGSISLELVFETKYNDQNELIERSGGWKSKGLGVKPSQEKKKLSFNLRFKYADDDVDILNYFNYEHNGKTFEEFKLVEKVKTKDLSNVLNSYTGIKQFLNDN